MHCPFRMQLLQGADADFSALQGGDALCSGTGGGQRGDRRYAGSHSGAADRFFVEPGLESRRSIDDQLDALSFDEVDDVRTSFFDLVDAFHIHAGGLDHVGGTGGGDQLESHVHEFAGDQCDVALVVIGDADEGRYLGRKLLSRSQLRLGKGFAEVIGDAHDLPGGFHLRAEHRIYAGELATGKHGRLHVVAASGVEIGAALDEVRQELAQLPSGHEAGGDLCHRNTRRLRNVRHSTGGARIYFEHIDFSALASIARTAAVPARNSELDVHQAHHFQRVGELKGVLAHAFEQRLRNIHRGQHAGRIAGVNAGLFDVLHNPADHDVFAVGERVHVDFDGIFEEVIDQHRSVVRVFDGFLHVAHDRLLVISDDHRSAPEHVGRPNQHRETDALGTFDCLFDGGRHYAGRLGNLQFFQQFIELLAVFCEVD